MCGVCDDLNCECGFVEWEVGCEVSVRDYSVFGV